MDESSLEGFLGFTDGDLAANRAGGLSPSQYRQLQWSGVWRLIVGAPVLVAAVVVALLVNFALFALIALLVAGVGLYVTWRGFAFLVDSSEGTVAYVTGPLRRRVVHSRYGVTYWANIGPVTSPVTAIAYNSLPEGLNCHLYYAPGCRTLLSVEPASAEEPKPAHAFGPDSAHVWDRLRWSWVLMTIGVLGALVGAHMVAVAHPAHATSVSGTVATYVERHGKSTSRTLYLAGDSRSYTPQSEDSYSPPMPPFGTFIGRQLVLYVNEGTNNVIAFHDGRQLHATDWYLYPEHQTEFEAANGEITGAVSVLSFLVGVALLALDRRRTARLAPPDPGAPSPLYAPPSVRPFQTNWKAILLSAAGVVIAAVAFALLTNPISPP